MPELCRNNPVNKIQTTGTTFQINNAKLYISVVTFSINDNIKFLENKARIQTKDCNKYRPEIITEPKKQWFRLADWSNT